MSSAQQIVTFPFRPHLALFLFHSIKGEILQTADLQHKILYVNLNSPHGELIRLILTRANYPNIKDVKQGFSLTISVPNRNWNKPLMEDGRYNELVMDPAGIDMINSLYQVTFDNHLLSYIAGRVASEKRGGLKKAIEDFIDKYELQGTEYTYEKICKMYHRSNFPLKSTAYAKKKVGIITEAPKNESNTLIDKLVKRKANFGTQNLNCED